MSHNTRQRRLAAQRVCDRILSGSRPATMRERLADLAAGGDLDGQPDFYGDGPVTTLEERVAELLGTEAAVFFPTGTMAQQVALRYGAEHSGHPTVALHPLGHLEVHERHAYANLSGLRSTWPTTEPRNPTAAEIGALAEPVGSVVIELPLRDAGALAALPGALVYPEPPHTQRFRLWLPYPAQALDDAALALAEDEKVWFAAGWQETDVPGMAMTEITVADPALDWTTEDVTEIGARFLSRAQDR
ncbi:beta-eliminating lyase-related protein [Micromonospora zamorensis]|uniref:beta-eliminating lyase-related protein n=1 Tax=Micromonospora zamorensis TaxID=709883 RepID=UPI0033C7778A